MRAIHERSAGNLPQCRWRERKVAAHECGDDLLKAGAWHLVEPSPHTRDRAGIGYLPLHGSISSYAVGRGKAGVIGQSGLNHWPIVVDWRGKSSGKYARVIAW